MNEVSLFRLYVLRAMYLLLVVGIGTMILPLLLDAPESAEHFRGVTWCLLISIALLSLVGVRHPLRMLPILFFEFTWKAVWLLAVGVPLWRSGQLEGAYLETWYANLFGVAIVPLAIPWGWVWRTYVRAPGDRWRNAKRAEAVPAPSR